ncbi:MAG: hypothetical protein WD733_06980 [Bryobacterales bacterium]
MSEAVSLAGALQQVALTPAGTLLQRWNWKSALLSSLVRGGIFFSTNLRFGLDAAAGAMLAEFCLRSITSGFCGALTQAFRSVRPAWKGMLAVLVLLPIANHALEITVHWLRGTPDLFLSIAVSVGFTVFSTSFNYFAMRRGVLTVGQGSQGLGQDLAQMPGLVWAYCGAIGVLIARAATAPWRLSPRRCCDENEA